MAEVHIAVRTRCLSSVDYTPDETAVIADWFARASAETRAHLAQVRSGPGSRAPAVGRRGRLGPAGTMGG
ncbi:hypothetical protein CP968_30285 [Streptomyces subrutilus]|uniref:Uncharacterized protein n=1 Tax=Streptomyces subrutilus TaxID=36818 RepID=A0A5P2UWT9_9ACTN|nr:hypothetical protein CP968_30285 [Streptomyces subrutilus]